MSQWLNPFIGSLIASRFEGQRIRQRFNTIFAEFLLRVTHGKPPTPADETRARKLTDKYFAIYGSCEGDEDDPQ